MSETQTHGLKLIAEFDLLATTPKTDNNGSKYNAYHACFLIRDPRSGTETLRVKTKNAAAYQDLKRGQTVTVPVWVSAFKGEAYYRDYSGRE